MRLQGKVLVLLGMVVALAAAACGGGEAMDDDRGRRDTGADTPSDVPVDLPSDRGGDRPDVGADVSPDVTDAGMPDAVPGDAGPDADAPPGPVTISGKVINFVHEPMAGVVVMLNDASTQTTTAADGTFSFPNVTPPYSLLAASPQGSIVYLNLRRTDPVLTVNDQPIPPNSATVSGTLAGINPPLAVNQRVHLGFGNPTVSLGTMVNNDLEYIADATWYGTGTLSTTLHALGFSVGVSGEIQGYLGYGQSQHTLSNGQTLSGNTITLSPVGSDFVSGSISGPTGPVALFSLSTPDGAGLRLGDFTPMTSFNWLVPTIPGTEIQLAALALQQGNTFSASVVTGLSPGATGVDVNVPGFTQVTTPAPMTTVTEETPIAWNKPASSISMLLLNVLDMSMVPVELIAVVTDDMNLTLAQIAAYDALPSPGTGMVFQVANLGPYASIDEATAGPGLLGTLFAVQGLAATRDGFVSTTQQVPITFGASP